MVGAVIVRPDGVIVGEGFHQRAGGPHAEIHALSEAGSGARGSTLYCTLEPCSHHGRTGPCARAIVDAGIRRVVAAMEDPNPLVHGRGFAFLREHGVEVHIGPGADRARELNQPFLTLMRAGRPFVVMKAAVSLDGRIAEAAGRRTTLTSAPANRHAHRVRAGIDAIAVGVGTILADDPLLTAREVHRASPLTRVIFDRQLRTPPRSRVLSTLATGPVIIVTSPAGAAMVGARQALEERGADIVAVPGGNAASEGTLGKHGSLASALMLLGQRHIGHLLLEGGATLYRAAWQERVVDYVRLYVTPMVLGDRGVPLIDDRTFSVATLEDLRVTSCGPDVIMEGYVHRPH